MKSLFLNTPLVLCSLFLLREKKKKKGRRCGNLVAAIRPGELRAWTGEKPWCGETQTDRALKGTAGWAVCLGGGAGHMARGVAECALINGAGPARWRPRRRWHMRSPPPKGTEPLAAAAGVVHAPGTTTRAPLL